jgi:hypothetical protein
MKKHYWVYTGGEWVKADYAQENQPDIGWLYYEIGTRCGFAKRKNWMTQIPI